MEAISLTLEDLRRIRTTISLDYFGYDPEARASHKRITEWAKQEEQKLVPEPSKAADAHIKAYTTKLLLELI